MADTKISGLTATTTLDDAAEVPLALSGANKKITGANLKLATLPNPASMLEVWVDYANGDDDQTGLAPSYAFKTIQAAYNALKTTAEGSYSLSPYGGIGRIRLLPGDHDVGTGFSGTYNRACEFLGTKSGGGQPGLENSASRIVSSSSSVTTMFDLSPTNATSYGWTFKDICFLPDSATNTSLTKIIRCVGDYLTVHDCTFINDALTNQTWTYIFHESHGDCSWASIERNWSVYGQFYCAPSATGTGVNFNRNRIMENVIFYGGSVPAIDLQGDWWNGSVCYNNLEGNALMIRVGSSSHSANGNLFVGNAGEANDGTNPFIHVVRGYQNVIVAGGTRATGVTNGTYVEFDSTTSGNMVMGAVSFSGSAGGVYKVVDNTSPPKNTVIGCTPPGEFLFPSLPTSDPGVAGRLWNSSGSLKVSV